MRRRRALSWLMVALLGVLPGCAWANRDNRPLWNGFENNAVPEDDVWFVVLLPVTVPAGLVAIVLDTFLVHPARVLDDSWGDASNLWRELEWEEHYYTECAALPLRAVATPVFFVGAFLLRSVFDIDPYEPPLTAQQRRERKAAEEAEHVSRWLAWFAALTAGEELPPPEAPVPGWSPELELAFQEARLEAPATGRAALFAAARVDSLPPLQDEPWMGLGDADPVVRYLVLESLPAQVDVPAELRRALREDPSETVRRLAERRWP